jgi:hypothetical protein
MLYPEIVLQVAYITLSYSGRVYVRRPGGWVPCFTDRPVRMFAVLLAHYLMRMAAINCVQVVAAMSLLPVRANLVVG